MLSWGGGCWSEASLLLVETQGCAASRPDCPGSGTIAACTSRQVTGHLCVSVSELSDGEGPQKTVRSKCCGGYRARVFEEPSAHVECSEMLICSPGLCGSVGWVWSHRRKGYQFNSWSGRLPGLLFLSLTFFLASPLSKK